MEEKFNIISVLIPHYNDERILTCLDKINKASFRKYLKVVIQDSCSELILLAQIKNKLNKNDKLIVKKDKGIFDALNILLDNIDTEYFTWLGSDDILDKDYNYYEINSLINKGHKLINCNVEYFKGSVTTRKIKAYEINYINYVLGKPIYHFATTLSVDLLKGIRFDIRKKTAADFEFFRKLFFINKLKSKNCTTSTVYMGDGGNSSKDFKARLDGYKDIFKSFLNFRIIIFPIFIIIRVYYKLKSKV